MLYWYSIVYDVCSYVYVPIVIINKGIGLKLHAIESSTAIDSVEHETSGDTWTPVEQTWVFGTMCLLTARKRMACIVPSCRHPQWRQECVWFSACGKAKVGPVNGKGR